MHYLHHHVHGKNQDLNVPGPNCPALCHTNASINNHF